MKRTQRTILTTLAALTVLANARGGEIGHYAGGLMNIRDFLQPPAPGFYVALYNYYYTTDEINDSHGDHINSVAINPPGGGPGVTLGVDVDVEMYVIAPAFMWVSDWKPLGARYAAFIVPTFANASINAKLSTATGRGGSVDESSFGVGDLFVQPLWLDWSFKHWDITLAYGFYAPIGKYDTETVTLPVVGPVTVESSENLGYGFWTQQFQSAVAWYPWEHKATAVMAALTYEINSEKEDFDLTPGDNLSLNWGISQYLPLKKDKTLLLEVGPAGYDTWQITDDSGSDAGSSVRDEVHAVGGQIGLTYVPWNLVANFHAFYEFAAKDRFQGQAFGLTVAIKF